MNKKKVLCTGSRRNKPKSKATFLPESIIPSIHRVRENLEVVSNRLRRSSELATRLDVEKIDISVDKYLKRLRCRKIELVKKVQKLSKMERSKLKEEKSFMSPPFISLKPMGSGPSSDDSSEFRRDPRLENIKHKVFNICLSQTGDIAPQEYFNKEDKSDLHHGSEAHHWIDPRWLDTYGTCLYHAWLNDDAAWWRDDDPDLYVWGYEVCWELPAQHCSGVMACNISCYAQADFDNNADDGGGFKVWFLMVHTDFEGRWPVGIHSSWWTELLSGKKTGTYIKNYFTSEVVFPIRKEKNAKVAVAFPVGLWSQDGLVEVDGQFGTHKDIPSSMPVPPRLNYTFTPVESLD